MIHLFCTDGRSYNTKDASSAAIFMWGRDTKEWYIAIPGCKVVDCQVAGGCVSDLEQKIETMLTESKVLS